VVRLVSGVLKMRGGGVGRLRREGAYAGIGECGGCSLEVAV